MLDNSNNADAAEMVRKLQSYPHTVLRGIAPGLAAHQMEQYRLADFLISFLTVTLLFGSFVYYFITGRNLKHRRIWLVAIHVRHRHRLLPSAWVVMFNEHVQV